MFKGKRKDLVSERSKKFNSDREKDFVLLTLKGTKVQFGKKKANYLWKHIKKANEKLPKRRQYKIEWGGFLELGGKKRAELNVQTYNWEFVELDYSSIGPNTIMTAHFHPQFLKGLEPSLEDLKLFDKFNGEGCIACWNGFKIWKKKEVIVFDEKSEKIWSED